MNIQTRTPHFKYKRPKEAPTVAITPDDDRLLLEVYRHDIIDAKTVFALLAPRSEDRIRRRLRRLFDAGFLQRLGQREQIFVPGGGSLPVAYSLGPRGARRMREAYGLKTKPDRYRGRDTSLSAQFIEHALEQTRFLVHARQAVSARPDIEFLYPDEIYSRYAPEILERPSLPSVVSAPVSWHGYGETEGTIPDGFFMLRYMELPEGENRRAIFLEIDRGTETIDVNERKQKTLKFWKDTSLLRKFVVYSYAFKRRMHQQQFGIPTFQVLTVTTNRERVGKMQEMYQKRLGPRPHSIAPNRFLFTDFETLAQHGGNILSAPLEDGMGRARALG